MTKLTIAALLATAATSVAAQITSYSIIVGTLGTPLTYQITADNQPTSFDATNLPPGLTCDRATGLISGIPTISGGAYLAQLVAHSPTGDAQATCSTIIYRAVPNADPVAFTMPAQYSQLIADPKRPRFYGLSNPSTSTDARLAVIDPNTLQEIKSVVVGPATVQLILSSDARTMWISRTSLNNSVARLDLDSLDQVVEIPTPGRVFEPREGLDDRLYVAGGNQEILQLNARTGVIEQRFTPGEQLRHISYPTLAISPDRKTLFVADLFYVGDSLVTHTALSRYDIASAVPVLLQRVEIPAPTIYSITPDPSGDWVYFGMGNFDGTGSAATHQTWCVSAHDLSVVRGALSYQGTFAGLTLTSDGRTIIQAVELTDGGQWMTGILDLFDGQSFQLKRSIVVGSVKSIGGGATVNIPGAVIDPSGSSLVAVTNLYPQNLRQYDLTPPPPAQTPPKSLLNISTRLLTQNGDNVLIGGFIVDGTEAKKVIVRGIGTSLALPGKLADPVLELRRADGTLFAENDNWNSNRQGVLATGIPPSEEREAALVVTLPPGSYTVVLRGAAAGTGIGIVEAYDLSPFSNSRLANISTRGRVEIDDNVMIAGFILGGSAPSSTRIVVRGIGPSLVRAGVSGALLDPMLELYDGNGARCAENDDWGDTQPTELQMTGLAPKDKAEAAIVASMTPGAYTAILRGKDSAAGIGLIEVYNLQQ
ncbi:MAG TPA: putative Ig domain-containing protein [Chthoniobacterales bacterium]|nr:putative Ig domain-containing protein [Chthoniobacterales bacterium]